MALIVVLTNISHAEPISDYNYEVLIGDGTTARSQVLARGKIEHHRRDDGWRALVQRVLDEGAPDEHNALDPERRETVVEAFMYGEDEYDQCQHEGAKGSGGRPCPFWCFWNSRDAMCSECARMRRRLEAAGRTK